MPDEETSLEAASAKYGLPSGSRTDQTTAKPPRRNQQHAGTRRRKAES
ncbi:hypothetical protein [Bradyrhizobium sp. JR3.5]